MTEELARLSAVCGGRVRPATAAEAVCGVVPRLVASPESTEEVAAVLRVADASGLSVVPSGSGSRRDWGVAPSSCDLLLDLGGLNRIVEHVAGDMVVEVEAGCRLDVLAESVAAAGQRLAVDAMVGTVGGLIATDRAGGLRYSYGTVRDLLLGVTMVRFDGVVARSGSRVVKNVAGYDLGKLLTGSFGSLGVVTRAILRLHPIPEHTVDLTATTDDPRRAADWVAALVHGQQEPASIDFDRPGNTAAITVTASFEGTEAGATVRAEASGAELRSLADGEVVVVTDAAAADGPATSAGADESGRTSVAPTNGHADNGVDGTGITVTIPPASWAEAVVAIGDTAAKLGLDAALHGSAGAGIVTAALPETSPDDAVATLLETVRAWAVERDGSAVVGFAPARLRDRLDFAGPVEDGVFALMRRVKDQFDPRHRLSPGRFVGRL